MPRYFAPLALVLAALTGACSTSPAADGGPIGTSGGAASATAPVAAVHDGRAIEITSTDTMKFSVTEIAAKAGEKLSITLVNLGTTPKFSMGHNLVLLTAGTDVPQFLLAAAEASTTEYVPTVNMKANVLAATKLLGPNERNTITFAAPAKPGRYDFLCSFPGHYQVGMRGVLIVQ